MRQPLNRWLDGRHPEKDFAVCVLSSERISLKRETPGNMRDTARTYPVNKGLIIERAWLCVCVCVCVCIESSYVRVALRSGEKLLGRAPPQLLRTCVALTHILATLDTHTLATHPRTHTAITRIHFLSLRACETCALRQPCFRSSASRNGRQLPATGPVSDSRPSIGISSPVPVADCRSISSPRTKKKGRNWRTTNKGCAVGERQREWNDVQLVGWNDEERRLEVKRQVL
jgi:hypothetical protein